MVRSPNNVWPLLLHQMPNVQFPKVTVTDSGFRLAGGSHEPLGIAWDDIVEIVAFKWDIFVYDVICLGFRLIGAEDFIEVAEAFSGYKNFIKAVESRFALAENWWNDVAFPAFETNWSTIWESNPRS